jgi:hypothetical protein
MIAHTVALYKVVYVKLHGYKHREQIAAGLGSTAYKSKVWNVSGPVIL